MVFPQLFEQRMQLLLQDEYDAFLRGYQNPLRRGLRVNTAKISLNDFLNIFPHTLEPSPFAQNSFYLDAEHKAGSDPLHHAGAYYMQEPSAASATSPNACRCRAVPVRSPWWHHAVILKP